MEDEVFEKDFERIYKAFQWLHNDKVKSELKQILEEIENNAYEKAIKDFNDLADGKICKRGDLMNLCDNCSRCYYTWKGNKECLERLHVNREQCQWYIPKKDGEPK
jgi:hypothetical protein